MTRLFCAALACASVVGGCGATPSTSAGPGVAYFVEAGHKLDKRGGHLFARLVIQKLD
jgi:hypothetical protein